MTLHTAILRMLSKKLSLSHFCLLQVLLVGFPALVHGDNLFANDGYFAPGIEVPLVQSGDSANCMTGLVAGVFESGTALFSVANVSKVNVRFATKKIFPINGDLMVFEVMARSTSPDANFAVIGITPDYKHIAHRHYRLTDQWRKCVAILAVPKSIPDGARRWRGLIDVPAGMRVEIGRLALYTAKNDESIAGMADSAEAEDRRIAHEPTLDDFDGPPPTSTAFASSQVGNGNPITPLPTRRSDEIFCDNLLGAALTGDAIVHCPPTGHSYTTWSPWWTIADDDLRRGRANTTFSTHMLLASATNATLTIRLASPAPLVKLRITSRNNGSGALPHDWHIDVSPDGVAFRTVHSARDFNARGVIPEIALDGSLVVAIRMTADRIWQEGKGFGYFQLDRIEAFDSEGVNHALVSKGAKVKTSAPMNVPVLDRASYIDDAIVDCGVKSVLVHVNIIGGWGDNSIAGGFAIGTPAYENLTDNMRYLKSRGVKTYMRLMWGRSIFSARTPEDQARFRADYIAKITPFVKAWKGLVACYPLGCEENQFCVLGRGEKMDEPFFKRSYREAVRCASEAIHAIDPDAKTSVTSALFDFGWTEEHLKNGLARVLDEVAVNIYRETDPFGSYPEKCYSFFVDGRRGLESERLFTRAEDEIKAFRALLDKYNPKLRFAAHEMSMRIGPYPRGMNSTEAGQAKFALRTYVMHQFYDISPSFWWSFNSGQCCESKVEGIEWGVICSGEKRQAWHAMQRFAALFDSSWKAETENPVVFTPADDRFYSYSFKRGNERLAACWTAVSMRDANTGKLVDAFVPGDFGGIDPKVECIDLFNGGVQKLNVERAEGGFKVRGFVMRDYPLVFRYSLRDGIFQREQKQVKEQKR